MKNILYSKLLVNSKDSKDGESATALQLTQEVNGFAVFVAHSFTLARKSEMIQWFSESERDHALEWVVICGPTNKRVLKIVKDDVRTDKP